MKMRPGLSRERRLADDAEDAGIETAPLSSTMGASWRRAAEGATLKSLKALKAEFSAGIESGRIAVEIPVDCIVDEAGSDRSEGWSEDPELQSLVDDIAARGQQQPIRVRPTDASWRPDFEKNGEITNQRFVLQSGRRRLEACRRLGRSVLAVLAYPEGEALQADLRERFLENRMRADLSPFERLVSIGENAAHHPDKTGLELAELLRIDPADVARGKRVYELRVELKDRVDTTKASRREILEAIRTLTKGTSTRMRPAEKARSAPATINRGFGRARIVAKSGKRGVSISISGVSLDPDLLEEIVGLVGERLAGARSETNTETES